MPNLLANGAWRNDVFDLSQSPDELRNMLGTGTVQSVSDREARIVNPVTLKGADIQTAEALIEVAEAVIEWKLLGAAFTDFCRLLSSGTDGNVTLFDARPRAEVEYSLSTVDLAGTLRAAFEADTFEDGIAHPIEHFLSRLTRNSSCATTLRSVILDDRDPALGADTLRCLGRVDRPFSGAWRRALIEDALRKPNMLIRDAAMQAVESWEDSSLADVLSGHVDDTPWLSEYAAKISADIAEGDATGRD